MEELQDELRHSATHHQVHHSCSMAPAKTHNTSTSTSTRVLVVLVLALALLVARLIPTEHDRAPRPTDARLFSGELLERSPLGDRVFARGDGEDAPRYAFGRWRQPVRDLAFHVDETWALRLQNLFTTKFWHYTSINADNYFIGAAVVNLGYASDAFMYVVDKSSNEYEKFEFTGRLPAGIGMTFASSSIDDHTCTSFTSLLSETISFCFDGETEEWILRANVTTIGATSGERRAFIADLRLLKEEALTLLFPVGNDTMRPAYVHKGAGSPVHGAFQFGSSVVHLGGEQLNKALGSIDWTRSQALRCTRWSWVSSSFVAKVTTTVDGEEFVSKTAAVGINLSKHVYDIDGESQENAIWIDGKVHILRGVEFTIPHASPLTEEWRIKSTPRAVTATHEKVDLTFTPSGGSREDHTHLLIVESDFVQPYGKFRGEIVFTSDHGKTKTRVEVEDAFGVVEDHYAVW